MGSQRVRLTEQLSTAHHLSVLIKMYTWVVLAKNFSSILVQIFLWLWFSCMCTKSFQSCPNSFATPWIPGYSPPGFSVHEILQARILEWVAMLFSGGSSKPRDWTHISYIFCIGWQILYHLETPGKPLVFNLFSKEPGVALLNHKMMYI